MLTAEKARELAQSKSGRLNRMLEPIVLGITNAANKGKFSAPFHVDYYEFTAEVLSELKMAGYDLSLNEDGFYIIRWS